MANYNLKSPSVKRILTEAKEMREPTDLFFAQPLEDNIFEWHFTVRGPADTPFAGGIYHGRIILPPEYPFKPPAIVFLTPNGRFELNMKICLSISSYHPEFWRPSWSIRTVLLALISFFPADGHGNAGAIHYSDEERAALAKKSTEWVCPTCKVANCDQLLAEGSASSASTAVSEADAEAIAQLSLGAVTEKQQDSNATTENGVEGDPSAPEPVKDIQSIPITDGVDEEREWQPTGNPDIDVFKGRGMSVAQLRQHIAQEEQQSASPQDQVEEEEPVTVERRSHALGDLVLTFLIWAVAGAIMAILVRKFSRM